ncbi:hypothetical protein RJ640_030236 [Escallonia rubra]|uniref:ATP-dependent zinc metalloprotease FTSH, chloroplastic n=1 Tax=Escallonia rubra TaxID=112253 RepID=A0AA88UQM2_9ASTE|nr:hypothetical protein RJ640_030236 [Escallonia rubra]
MSREENTYSVMHNVLLYGGQVIRELYSLLRSLVIAILVLIIYGVLLDDMHRAILALASNDFQPIIGSNTTFKDVMAVDEAKAELEEIVQYLRDPMRFTRLGGRLPKGVLLVGPPGTGKTLLARALAGEAGVPFFPSSGSEFEEMLVGVGAKRMRDLFSTAKKHTPCIIFIDEIDAVGGRRTHDDASYTRMTLNQLLVEMDGFQQNAGIIVVAATNFPESLDKALVRPGRFDRLVVVPSPDVEGRRQILESYLSKVLLADDVDVVILARGTTGLSGADLANLVNIAALKAAKDGAKAVSMVHLEHAKDKILMGVERKSAVISENSRWLTAFHEAGHALVALHASGALPVYKVTIIPRGMALGMVTQLPDTDETSLSRQQMLARLDVLMGGRAAEELVGGEGGVTSGALSDFKEATSLAVAMVTKFGMSKEIGLVFLDYEDSGEGMSNDTRLLIEREVRQLLKNAHQNAKTILTFDIGKLFELAHALLAHETLTGSQITVALSSANSQLQVIDDNFESRTAVAHQYIEQRRYSLDTDSFLRTLASTEFQPIIGSSTTFKDVMGVDEAKAELEEIIQYLRDPVVYRPISYVWQMPQTIATVIRAKASFPRSPFTRLGGRLPKGVLLVGPPGTGKTMLARAIAGEAGVPFFLTSGSEFEEMLVGVGAKRMRDLFSTAKKHSPCIIFIDEIDSFGGKRSHIDASYTRMTLNQLLVEMDGFKQNAGIVVIAATNFLESLDKALVRPGRFDRIVVVPSPDVEGRRQILESYLSKVLLADDVDVTILARGTSGLSGADLANLVNIAALKAANDGAKAVSMVDLEHAKDKILMGVERKSSVISAKSRRLAAFHEGGHALVAVHTSGALPVYKVTIIPRGMALGMVTQLPDTDETSLSRQKMLARLDVLMGGRAAEELVFGESGVSSGGSSDLKEATSLAVEMVTKFGMSKEIGPVFLDYEDSGKRMSSGIRLLIEKEVSELLKTAHQNARSLLITHLDELFELADALLVHETLTGSQIEEVLSQIKSQVPDIDHSFISDNSLTVPSITRTPYAP